MALMTYTAASFFTGIGGLDLAAIAAGFEIASISEVDDYCCELLAQRFPNVPNLGDIRDVRRADLPGQPDLIFGGFPCQDISSSGAGQGLRGARSGLYMELERIICDVRPRLVVLENVANVTFRGAERIVAGLSAAGYDGIWLTIPTPPAIPHIRRRWFYVGHTNSHGQIRPQAPRNLQSHTGGYHKVYHRRNQRLTNEAGATGGYRRAARRGRLQPGMAIKSAMGGATDGLSRQLDGHQWPAGSWQPQAAHESPRLTPNIPARAARLQSLGNAVVPQQALPVFEAAYAFLQSQDEATGS